MQHGISAPARAGDPVIVATNLTKTYTFHRQQPGLLSALKSVFRRTTETRLAVDAIDLEICSGEVVGLLGPNGAGKTTTLKMLSGLLYPTSGHLGVLGHTPSKRDVEFLRRISLVMGQKSMLWWDVPAMDTFLLHQDMYALGDRELRQSIDELATMLDVEHLLHVQVRKLSLGERMKLELMTALLHRPDVVFLDEPTIGLDVVAKARVRSFLADVNRERGTTILVTSHDMDDIEALCSRVVIIDRGRIEHDGDLRKLVQDIQPRKLVRAAFADPVLDTGPLDALGVGPADRHAEDDGRVLSLEVSRDCLAGVLEALPRMGALLDLSVNDADVEEIIRGLFSREGVPA